MPSVRTTPKQVGTSAHQQHFLPLHKLHLPKLHAATTSFHISCVLCDIVRVASEELSCTPDGLCLVQTEFNPSNCKHSAPVICSEVVSDFLHNSRTNQFEFRVCLSPGYPGNQLAHQHAVHNHHPSHVSWLCQTLLPNILRGHQGFPSVVSPRSLLPGTHSLIAHVSHAITPMGDAMVLFPLPLQWYCAAEFEIPKIFNLTNLTAFQVPGMDILRDPLALCNPLPTISSHQQHDVRCAESSAQDQAAKRTVHPEPYSRDSLSCPIVMLDLTTSQLTSAGPFSLPPSSSAR